MVITLFVFILGLIFGSFINALLYRYENRISINGRSFCPKCKKQIRWYDNIPLLSWLLLKGKCRYCNKNISVQYPLVELAGGVLMLLAAQGSGFLLMLNNFLFNFKNLQPSTFLAFIILSLLFLILLTISIYDFKKKEIPNGFNLSFVLVAFIYLLATNFNSQYYLQNTFYFLVSATMAFTFFYSLAFFSKEKWMGGGDAKLAFGIGLLLGPVGTFLAILVASWMGSIYGLATLAISKKGNSHLIPFGPFLALGTLISFMFGSQIIDWYVKIFLGL